MPSFIQFLPDAAAVLAGYLLGSVSFAVFVCRMMMLPDPRTVGSGNPGATNVMRTGDKAAGVMTLFGDAVKAVFPMVIARAAGLAEITVALVGFAAFIGHLYPLYHSFRGGKGVVTFVGVLGVMHWPAVLVWGGAWLMFAGMFRYVSVASMAAGAAAAVYLWNAAQPGWAVGLAALMALLVVARHAGNIRRLLSGTEGKIGRK